MAGVEALPVWVPDPIRAAYTHVVSLDVVELTAHFLRACREQQASLEAARQHRAILKPPGKKVARRIGAVEGAAAMLPLVAHLGSGDLAAYCAAAALLAERTGVPAPHAPAMCCRLAAELIDARCGHLFATVHRLPRAAIDLHEPVLRFTPNLSAIFDKGFGFVSTADRLEEFPIDQVPRLGLAATAGMRMQVDDGVFPVPDRNTKIAWLDPATRVLWPGETGTGSEMRLAITRRGGEGGPHHFEVLACDAAANTRDLLDLLSRADAEEATIAISPELTVCESAVAAARTWLRTAQHTLMIVCGSAHVARNGRRNRATILVRRAGAPQVVEYTHDKFNPVNLEHEGAQYYEDIVGDPPSLAAYVCLRDGVPCWSYAYGICKDLLVGSFAKLLDEACISMLLAPTMTWRTESFVNLAAGFAGRHQTTSVLANHDPAPDGSAAIVLVRPTTSANIQFGERPADRLKVLFPFRSRTGLRVKRPRREQ